MVRRGQAHFPALKTDRIFNEMSLIRAKMKASHLALIQKVVAEAPNHYMNSHFTGSVFSVIFEQMRGSALAEVMGEDRFDAFVEAVRQDAGIGHILAPPHIRESWLRWACPIPSRRW